MLAIAPSVVGTQSTPSSVGNVCGASQDFRGEDPEVTWAMRRKLTFFVSPSTAILEFPKGPPLGSVA